MALAGPLAGARLIALDTSTFIDLIEKHPVFFGTVEPILQAIDAGLAVEGYSINRGDYLCEECGSLPRLA